MWHAAQDLPYAAFPAVACSAVKIDATGAFWATTPVSVPASATTTPAAAAASIARVIVILIMLMPARRS
jgi:hypothetical protein